MRGKRTTLPRLHLQPAINCRAILSLLQEENGHLVMMGLFDCVDDTVLVRKALLSVSCNCHHMMQCEISSGYYCFLSPSFFTGDL